MDIKTIIQIASRRHDTSADIDSVHEAGLTLTATHPIAPLITDEDWLTVKPEERAVVLTLALSMKSLHMSIATMAQGGCTCGQCDTEEGLRS